MKNLGNKLSETGRSLGGRIFMVGFTVIASVSGYYLVKGIPEITKQIVIALSIIYSLLIFMFIWHSRIRYIFYENGIVKKGLFTTRTYLWQDIEKVYFLHLVIYYHMVIPSPGYYMTIYFKNRKRLKLNNSIANITGVLSLCIPIMSNILIYRWIKEIDSGKEITLGKLKFNSNRIEYRRKQVTWSDLSLRVESGFVTLKRKSTNKKIYYQKLESIPNGLFFLEYMKEKYGIRNELRTKHP